MKWNFRNFVLVCAGLALVGGLVRIGTKGNVAPDSSVTPVAYNEPRPPHPLDGTRGRDGSMEEVSKPLPCLATYDLFRKVKSDDHYDKVRRLVGCEGELVSSSKIDGTKFETYQWAGATFLSNMTIMFKNRRVFSTGQLGLK